jgi:adenosylcobinamide kinase / adenosylcobinamide-phosphate guanylyltransferase
MPLVLLIGGARSGKSRLALRLAERREPVVFLATGEPGDEEMRERIERHRRDRPAGWRTVEEPLRLRAALDAIGPEPTVVVECLSLWLANMLEASGPAGIEDEAHAAAEMAARRPGLTVAVTNEVGLGLVPANPLGRGYRDLLGRTNAIWADAAEEALLVVAGQMLPLRRAVSVFEELGA